MQPLKSTLQAAIAMLAEAGGTFIALQNMVSGSSKDIASHLFNVGYYLHYQATATSFKGLSQFTRNATRLLQRHVSNGQYNVSQLSSDAAKLNEILPGIKSIEWTPQNREFVSSNILTPDLFSLL